MPKQLMSFRFNDSTVNYLQGVVKYSELSMTDYIEGLIELDRDSTSDIGWDKGCVITSDGRMIVISKPYYMTQINLLEDGIGIIAAIPDTLIPLEKCLELAVAQTRKCEDIIYNANDDFTGSGGDVCYIYLSDSNVFAKYLSDTFNVNVKAGILG